MDLHLPFSLDPHPVTPLRILRRQESLEATLDFTTASTIATPPPAPHQIAEAFLLYTTILQECRRANIALSSTASTPPLHPFFLAIYEHCPSVPGKSNILFVVLHALFPPPLPGDYTNPLHRDPSAIIPRARCWLHPTFDPIQRAVVYCRLQTLADDLLRGFFVPLKAAGGQTPTVSSLVSPRSRGDVGPEQGTPTRLYSLRENCLLRDGHRCIATHDIDIKFQEAYNLLNPGSPSEEDNAHIEVAHIIPHSFNALNGDGTLGDSRTYIWRVMNMFDPGISHTISGYAIDSPRNAMALCHELHHRFGQLKWYLEPTATPHTYTMHTVRGHILPRRFRPVSGYITFNFNGTVAPPDPRLLAFHRACCLMLSMSGAGECVDYVLRDMEDLAAAHVLAADGSSDLAQFWRLKEILGEVVAY